MRQTNHRLTAYEVEVDRRVHIGDKRSHQPVARAGKGDMSTGGIDPNTAVLNGGELTLFLSLHPPS